MSSLVTEVLRELGRPPALAGRDVLGGTALTVDANPGGVVASELGRHA